MVAARLRRRAAAARAQNFATSGFHFIGACVELNKVVRGPRALPLARRPLRARCDFFFPAACTAWALGSEATRLAAGRYEAACCPVGAWGWSSGWVARPSLWAQRARLVAHSLASAAPCGHVSASGALQIASHCQRRRGARAEARRNGCGQRPSRRPAPTRAARAIQSTPPRGRYLLLI